MSNYPFLKMKWSPKMMLMMLLLQLSMYSD
jgi:hypothetical protein